MKEKNLHERPSITLSFPWFLCPSSRHRSAVCRSCLWIMRSSTSAEATEWSWDRRSGSAYPTARGQTWCRPADVVSPLWSHSHSLFLPFLVLLSFFLFPLQTDLVHNNQLFLKCHVCLISIKLKPHLRWNEIPVVLTVLHHPPCLLFTQRKVSHTVQRSLSPSPKPTAVSKVKWTDAVWLNEMKPHLLICVAASIC